MPSSDPFLEGLDHKFPRVESARGAPAAGSLGQKNRVRATRGEGKGGAARDDKNLKGRADGQCGGEKETEMG